MKKITLMLLAVLTTALALAQTDAVVTPPDGAKAEPYALTGTLLTSDATKTVSQTVQVVRVGKDFYVQGLSYWMEEAWAKGTVEDGRVTFGSNQLMGTDDYGDDYLVGLVWVEDETDEQYGGDYAYAPEFCFDCDSETGVLTLAEGCSFGETDAKGSADVWNLWENVTLTPGEAVGPTVVTPPEGVVPQEWHLNAVSLNYKKSESGGKTPVYTPVESVARVAVDGGDAYVQGLCGYLPEAWVKGRLEEGRIVLPAGQYYGPYQSLFNEQDLYFIGYGNKAVGDVTFTFSDDGLRLTADKWVMTNSNATEAAPYEILTDVVLTKVVERAGKPATPQVVEFQDWNDLFEYGLVGVEIPIVDTEGRAMAVDKLSYRLIVDEDGKVGDYVFECGKYASLEADLTEVPFTLSDRRDFDVDGTVVYVMLKSPTQTYTRLGVQSIYRGGGEEHASDVAWYPIERGGNSLPAVGADGTDAARYNLAGQRVEKTTRKGIYIQNGKKIVSK